MLSASLSETRIENDRCCDCGAIFWLMTIPYIIYVVSTRVHIKYFFHMYRVANARDVVFGSWKCEG